ncbi:hypothetical protein ABPG75_008472 [Micractinium tetrahymenae]
MFRGRDNRFGALASSETRAEKKRERAADHAAALAEARTSIQQDDPACTQPRSPSSGQAGQPYSLALAADNLLVALEAGSGCQLACFTISGPEQAADPGFLSWVRQQLGEQAAEPAAPAPAHLEEQAGAGSGSGGAGRLDGDEAEVDKLLSLVMVGDGSSAACGTAAGQRGTVATAAAAPRAAAAGEPVTPRAAGAGAAAAGAAQWPASPAEVWFDAPEEPAVDDWQLDGQQPPQQQASAGWQPQQQQQQQQQHSGNWCQHDEEDWRLAALLQAEEDAAMAAAAAEQAPLPASDQQLLSLSDWELVQRMQEEEDAALAAALAEQEQAAGVSAAQVAAQQSSSFWSRLQPAGGAYLHGSGGSGAAATAPAANSSFPALQAQLPNDPLAAARAEHTRRQLLARHRAAKQATIERGSGVRLLHRGGGPASAAGSPALAPAALQGSGAGGGLPPLQLVGGLVLHEDDLDYQLLLRHADVTAAARAAAIRHMDLTEAAAEGGGPADANGPTSAAMRAMIDAAARRAAAGAGGSRPGSAQAAAAPAPAGTSRPGSSASGNAGDGTAGEMPGPAAAAASAGSGVSLPAVAGPFIDSSAPVDTKSFRRLVEDMRSRGWQMLGSAGGGHLRCERVLPDLGGFKQVYFLCSTPSDVNYIWNVAAAVKRFDREVEERRAEAAAAPEVCSGDAGAQGSSGAGVSGRRTSSWQRR